jgi:hypothetical protein
MKDLDTKKLGEMYESVAGVPQYDSVLITEDVGEFSTLLTEDMVNTLGKSLSSKLVTLIKREMPASRDPKRLEKIAETFITCVEDNVSSSMISRAFRDYDGVSSLSKAQAIYQLLS